MAIDRDRMLELLARYVASAPEVHADNPAAEYAREVRDAVAAHDAEVALESRRDEARDLGLEEPELQGVEGDSDE